MVLKLALSITLETSGRSRNVLNSKNKVENVPFFYGVIATSAAKILKKTGLTIHTHELIAGFPHPIINSWACRQDFRLLVFPD